MSPALLSLLPDVLHLPAGGPDDDGGVAATLRLLSLELGARPPGSRAVSARLVDIMLVHVLRGWLRSQHPGQSSSWIVALRDPVVGRALMCIHERPAAPWTVDSLAAEVNVSRATLARRFVTRVGETPLAYVTRWRMDVAAQSLRDGGDTVAAIATAVGYRSEYAFSRAFSRQRGIAPGRYRREARGRRAELDAA